MNVGSFLVKALPYIGAAATGNVPALASLAAQAIGSVVGKKVGTDPGEMEAAVAGASPEQLAALQQAELDFKAKMQAMGFEHEEDLLKIGADDRANARAREISLKDKYVPFLATFVIASATVAILAVLRGWGKVESAFAGTLIGYLSANANQVVSYYFGSSATHDAMTEGKSTDGKS